MNWMMRKEDGESLVSQRRVFGRMDTHFLGTALGWRFHWFLSTFVGSLMN